MAGDSVTSFMIVYQLLKASFASIFTYGVTPSPVTVSVEMTNNSLKANATRCRNWSLPFSTACHHSEVTQAATVPQYEGLGVGTAASTVGGVWNCSFSQAVIPSCCTCWIRLVVGPKVL